MIDFIVTIHGKTKHTITIDPTVWIFDDRKIDLNEWEGEEKRESDELEKYKKNISAQWDKEITEGAQIPRRDQTNRIRNKKEALIDGTFGMPFAPFLDNATPLEEASKVVIETKDKTTYIVSLEEARKLVIGFSKNGKPLQEDGPVHVYYGDGSNKEQPILHVTGFRIE